MLNSQAKGYGQLLALFMVLCSEIGRAEAMDKEFSMATLWLWVLYGGLFVYLAARYRPCFLPVLLSMIGSFIVSHIVEVMDPYVGPAMAIEAFIYFTSWAIPVSVFVSGVVGFVLRHRSINAHI